MKRTNRYYTSVTRRLLFAFFCLSFLPIAAIALMTKNSLQETNKVRLQEQAVAVANAQSERISAFLDDKVQMLTLLAGFLPQSYFADSVNTEKLFLAIGGRGDYVDLQAIAADGSQYGYAGPYRSKISGKDYANAPWFQETLLKGVHISDLFTGYRGVPHFVAAVTNPLKSYVLRATINSSSFNAMVRPAQLSPNSDAFIINRESVLQTPSLRGETAVSQSVAALVSGGGKTEPLITAEDIYIARPLAGGRWFLIVRANIADSFAAWLPIRKRIFLITAAIFLTAAAAAAALSLLLTRHIRQADQQHAADSLQFAHMEKMATIGRLAAGIAHEINNPLQIITSQASWIAELLEEEEAQQVKNIAEYQESVGKIRHHVKRAGTITHRLLGFSRKIAEKQEEINVNALLQEAASFLKKEAESGNIAIVLELDSALPAITSDAAQLQQVFLNLINNGIDAAAEAAGESKEKKGILSIISKKENDTVVIHFADSGFGIRKEHLKQIFDPFFTTKLPGKGTGLGLYISYDIIHKLGGSIKAANQEKGGALFTLSLPLSPAGRAQGNAA